MTDLWYENEIIKMVDEPIIIKEKGTDIIRPVQCEIMLSSTHQLMAF